ncbi:MAG: YdcF family protein, partial [Pseudomonas sp.]
MPLRYILKQLLLPPGGLLLLLLVGWWLRRRAPRLSACCFVLGFAGLWIMSLPLAVEWGARALESEPALGERQWRALSQRAEAIVVLGGGREQDDPAWGGDQPGAVDEARLAGDREAADSHDAVALDGQVALLAGLAATIEDGDA